LYHALKAFGQIQISIFILRVIDEPVMPEKVLSGIEHVHAFTRAVWSCDSNWTIMERVP
jgi:hypothetical protein